MKKKLMKLFFSISLLSVVFLDIQTPINVRAEGETTIEAGLEIDESIGELTGLFDSIGRFNKNGFAKIAKTIYLDSTDEFGVSISTPIEKYGLINLEGQIILEPIYDVVTDYNDVYWLIGQYSQPNEYPSYVYEGLVSKITGEIVLEPKYQSIPDFSTTTLFGLNYSVKTEVNGETKTIYRRDMKASENGIIRDIILPSYVNEDEGLYFYARAVEKQIVMSAYRSSYNGDTEMSYGYSWLVNEFGDTLVDFKISDIREIYTREDGAIFVLYSEHYDYLNNVDYVGLIKIVQSESGYHYQTIISHDAGYRYFSIDRARSKVWYGVELNGEFQQYSFNLLTEESQIETWNSSFTNPIDSMSQIYNDLMIRQVNYYNSEDSYGVYYEAYQGDSPENLLKGHIFDSYREDNGFVVFLNSSQTDFRSNILVKNSQGSIGLLFENDLDSYISPAANGLITTQKFNSNIYALYYYKDDALFTLYENENDAWYWSSGSVIHIVVTTNHSDGSQTINRSLYDLIGNRYILKDVSQIDSIWVDENGQKAIIGNYRLTNQPKMRYFFYTQGTVTLLSEEAQSVENIADKFISVRYFMNYLCINHVYDQQTGTYRDVETQCSRDSYDVFDLKGVNVIEDVDTLDFRNDSQVILAKESAYDPIAKHRNPLGISYYSLNHFDSDGNQMTLAFKYYDKIIEVEEQTYQLVDTDGIQRFAFVRNGVLLSTINQDIIDAIDIGNYDQGSFLFSEMGELGLEVYFRDQSGLITAIPGVSSMVGNVVKIGNSLFYVDVDDLDADLYPQLTSLDLLNLDFSADQLISNDNFNHLTKNLYSYRKDNGMMGLFKTSIQNGSRTFDIIRSQAYGASFCSVVSVNQSNHFFQFVQFQNQDSQGCTYWNALLEKKIGLIDDKGSIIIQPDFYYLYVLENSIIANAYSVDEEQPNTIKMHKSFFDLAGHDPTYNQPIAIANDFDEIVTVGDFINSEKAGIDYAFVFKENQFQFLGNYEITLGTDGYYRYSQQSAQGTNSGLIDATGNIIISIDAGYVDFYIDKTHQLISGKRSPMYVYSRGQGLFDIAGNRLLSDDYELEWRNNSLNINKNQNLKVFKSERNIILGSRNCLNYDCSEFVWNESAVDLFNYYNIETGHFLSEVPLLDETQYSDGFTKLNALVRSDATSQDEFTNDYRFFKYDDGLESYFFDIKPIILNASDEFIVNIGSVDLIEWDVSKNVQRIGQQSGIDDYGYRTFKWGIITKLGNVIIPVEYDSINYWDKYDVYFISKNEDEVSKTGLIDKDGHFLIEPKYNISTEVEGDLEWLWMFSPMDIIDPNRPDEVFKTDTLSIYDIKNKRMIVDQINYFYNEKLNSDGFVIVEKLTGSGTVQEYSYIDEYGEEIPYTYVYPNVKYGVLKLDGTLSAEPIYDSIQRILGPNYDEETFKGLFKVGLAGEIYTGYDTYYDYEKHEIVSVTFDMATYKYGILNLNENWFIEPIYDHVSSATNGIVRTGLGQYTIYPFEQYIEEIDTVITSYWVGIKLSEYGLVDLEKGVILDPVYASLTSTYPGKAKPIVPLFDGNGFIKISKNNINESTGENTITYGLANRNGVVIDPIYLVAEYKNGYFTLLDQAQNWTYINASNPQESGIIGHIDLTDSQVVSIELIGNYIKAEVKITTDLETYFQYGLLNRDLSIALPFDYVSIGFDGTFWYLERYDNLTGSYPKEVLDFDLNVVIDESANYDSLSEFVGGYAIGQSGTKEEPIVTLDKNFSFMRVLTETQPFVLEIIDAQGKVVGDLSQDYESATLIGISDGKVKALVKKDGLFYIATLVLREVIKDTTPPIITIDPYTSLETSESIIVTASTNEGSLNTTSHTFTENGSFTFVATDDAGNVSEVTITITNIIKTKTVNFTVSGLGGSLSASVNGSFISSGSKHPIGSTITFSASPNAGWIITQWSNNGMIMNGKNSTFEVTALLEDVSVTVEFGLLGDLNLDGFTTKADLSIFAKVMASKVILSGKALLVADMNQDGTISATDLAKLSKLLSTLK